MEVTIPNPFPKLRYQWLNDYPVAMLAAHVGIGAEAVAWCEVNHVVTLKELHNAFGPGKLVARSNCPAYMVEDLLRLLDPPGTPADWPLHPDADIRVAQVAAHAGVVCNIIMRATLAAKDRWLGFLYLVHFEDNFMKLAGVGTAKLPLVLAWRDEMRLRFPRPEHVLDENVLHDRDWTPGIPLQPDRFATLWQSAAKQEAQGYIGAIRYAGRTATGINRLCLVTATVAYVTCWPDWAFALAKEAVLNGRRVFVIARGEPVEEKVLEVHLLEH